MHREPPLTKPMRHQDRRSVPRVSGTLQGSLRLLNHCKAASCQCLARCLALLYGYTLAVKHDGI